MKPILCVLWLVLLAGVAHAAAQLSLPSEVDLGDIGINTTGTAQFTISNTGDAPLTNVVLSADTATYNVGFTNGSLATIAAGSSATVTVNATIPVTDSQEFKTLNTITVTANEASGSFPLKAHVIGRLIIEDLDIDIDGQENNNLQNATAIPKTAKPGSRIDFNVRMKNTFTSAENTRIEDVIVTITIEGIDDGDDIDKDSNTFDLPAGRGRGIDLSFTLPDFVEEDTYTVNIEAEGDDENGRTHTARLLLDLDVERENHDILIQKQAVSPVEAVCGGSADVSFTLLNYGQGEEPDVAYNVRNDQLGMSVSGGPFYLEDPDADEGYSTRITRTLHIPGDAKPGTYPLEIRSYYDFDKVSNLERVILDVTCEAQTAPQPEPEAPEEKSDVVIEEPRKDEIFTLDEGAHDHADGTHAHNEAAVQEQGLSQGMKIALLVLANIIILGAVGLVILKLLVLRTKGR